MNAYYTAIDSWFFFLLYCYCQSFGKLLGFITFLSLCSVFHLYFCSLPLFLPSPFQKTVVLFNTRNWVVRFLLSSFYLGDVPFYIYTSFWFYLYSVHVILGRFNLAAVIIWVYSNFFCLLPIKSYLQNCLLTSF